MYPSVLCVAEMVMALIDSAYDKDGRVKQVITDSLFELGKKQPALVLSSCHYYLVKHSKVKWTDGKSLAKKIQRTILDEFTVKNNFSAFSQLTTGHRVVILTCIERILKETLDQLEKDLAETVIKQASFELTSSKVSQHTIWNRDIRSRYADETCHDTVDSAWCGV